MRKKLFFIVFLFFLIFNFKNISEASTKKVGIENFPDSYKPYLYELKKKYPNWQFTALYTGLDWNTVIANEYANNKNLVPLSYSDDWKCLDSGIYNVEIDKGWVNASKRAVEYTMDPRNFLNEVRIFQFEKLTYDSSINNESGVDKILYGTEFYNKLVSYVDEIGNVINTSKTYAKLIMESGIYSGVNPYHLAARIKQEVGPFLSHNSISGLVEGYRGLYNFYNIGATSSVEPLGAIKNGLQYARNGKGNLSEIEIQNQLIPWDTPEKAIKGGAVFIGKSYIVVGQNCLYLQKFDVNDDRSNELFWHQYMTNCLAPYNESKSIYNAYSSLGFLDSLIGFVIPVYENMPELAVSSPNINLNGFIDDNTRVYANVSTVLNVRSGPGTLYEIITSIPAKNKFTRIGTGVQNGERWDKILLDNGIVGYVFQNYVAEVEEIVEKVELDNSNIQIIVGQTMKINAIVYPNNITNMNIKWSSDDSSIASVNNNGEITAISEGETVVRVSVDNVESYCNVKVIKIKDNVYFEIDNNVNINGDELSSVNVTDINEFMKMINTNLNVEFYDNAGKLIEDYNSSIGTGYRLCVKDNDGKELYNYYFIIYGDVNGDGDINSLDVLVLQKYILEIKNLDGLFLKAGNISKNNQLPNSLDVLKIQKHILEIQEIQQ